MTIKQMLLSILLINTYNAHSMEWANGRSLFGRTQPGAYKPSEEVLNKKHDVLKFETTRQRNLANYAQYFYDKRRDEDNLSELHYHKRLALILEKQGNTIYYEIEKTGTSETLHTLIPSTHKYTGQKNHYAENCIHNIKFIAGEGSTLKNEEIPLSKIKDDLRWH